MSQALSRDVVCQETIRPQLGPAHLPWRTDIEAPTASRQNKQVLFGQQEGPCNGCKGDFPFRLFEVDRRVPRSRGGTDHLNNLQLLCSSCDYIKCNRLHECPVARLAEILS